MILSEIRVGWQIVMRNGETSVVKCDGDSDPSLPFVKGFVLGDYNADLTSRRYPDHDIVEVYGWPGNLPKGGRLSLFYKKYRKLLWKDESRLSAAVMDEEVECEGAKASVCENDGRLILTAIVGGSSFTADVCENGSRDELITNGERIDYEVFRSLSIKCDGDGFTLSVYTARGNAVYLKSRDTVTADEERVTYVYTLDEQGLCMK